MVEGGSGAGAAAVGAAAPAAFVAPVASVEVGGPVGPTVGAEVGGSGPVSPAVSTEVGGPVTPVGGPTEVQDGQAATDADRLAGVQDRLAQQGGEGEVPATGDEPETAQPPVTAESPADGETQEGDGVGETPANGNAEAPVDGESETDGEPTTGGEAATGTEPAAGAEQGTGEPAAEGEGAVDAAGDTGDLEFADPATITQVGLDTGQTRLALQVLAGRLNVHGAAAHILQAEMRQTIQDLPKDASRGMRLGRIFRKATIVPQIMQQFGVTQAEKGVGREAGRHAQEAQAIAQEAYQLLMHGDPVARAFALDAQIETLRSTLRTVSGEAETQLKAQIEGIQAERGALTTEDGKTIPNQMQTMALRFAQMFEPEGQIPPDAITNPMAYMQGVYARAVSRPSSAHQFFSEFAAQGMIEPEAVKELTGTYHMEWNSPKIQALFAAAKGSAYLFFGFLATLYFKMKGQGGRGRAPAGAH